MTEATRTTLIAQAHEAMRRGTAPETFEGRRAAAFFTLAEATEDGAFAGTDLLGLDEIAEYAAAAFTGAYGEGLR